MTHGATDMLFKEVNACAEQENLCLFQKCINYMTMQMITSLPTVGLPWPHHISYNSVAGEVFLLDHRCLINSFA